MPNWRRSRTTDVEQHGRIEGFRLGASAGSACSAGIHAIKAFREPSKCSRTNANKLFHSSDGWHRIFRTCVRAHDVEAVQPAATRDLLPRRDATVGDGEDVRSGFS